MMIACEREFLKVQERIERLWESVCRAREDGRRIDEVERAVFAELMQMGWHVMKAFVETAGDGDLGETLEVPARSSPRRRDLSRQYSRHGRGDSPE